MASSQPLRLLLPKSLRTLPVDLVAALLAVALLNVAVFAPVVRDTPLRVPIGLAFAFFVPGYVLLAALFPERGELPDDSDDQEAASPRASWPSGIDGLERVILSFGLSIMVVPLTGVALDFTPWGIQPVPIVLTLSALTLIATLVAAVNRRAVPEERRFRVPYRTAVSFVKPKVQDGRAELVVNVALVAAILFAVGTLGYAVMAPQQGETYSELSLLTERNGDLITGDYPTALEPGESAELVVGVENREQQTVDYTVVILEQAVTSTDGIEAEVETQRELDRFETRLNHGETWHYTHDLEPTATGDDVRIVWLLYLDDDVPTNPTVANADYHVHLWVTVSDEPDSAIVTSALP